ncbi:MAG: hypothetical protein ACI8RD_012810 [Bacillariaceae sp.]|jgi:hypothetical protein
MNDNHEMQEKLKERRDDSRDEKILFQRFQNVATLKLERMTKQTDSADAGQNELKMGEEEQRIISSMNGMGLKEGVLAGVASFIILRRGPRYIRRWVLQRRTKRNYVLSDPNKLTRNSNSNSNNNNNPFYKASNRNEFPRPISFLSRSIWLAFDSVLSLLVGTNISIVCTDKDTIRKQIVKLPLVSGRSLTADALCDDIVEELRKVREEKNSAYERLKMQEKSQETAAAFFMDGIVQFCENCERRRFYERRIREERGLGKTDQVEIPIPGVPSDAPRLVVSISGEETVVDTDGIEDPFLEQFGNDSSWA